MIRKSANSRRWRFSRSALGTLVALAATPSFAQVVVATVKDRSNGAPVAYALVSIEDRTGARHTTELAGPDGVVLLRVRAGTYSLRVDRAGIVTWRGAPFSLDAHDTLRLTALVSSSSRSLGEVRIVGTTECAADPTSGDVGTVWQAARRELSSAERGAALNAPALRVQQFERERDRHDRVLDEHIEVLTVRKIAPYRTRRPAMISDKGYLVLGHDVDLWFAPDAAVLLSEEFAADHCFRLVSDREHPGEIGLAFVPLQSRRVVDIAGTFWIDRESGALLRVTYLYQNVSELARLARAGGRIEFGTLADGRPTITAWEVRTPRIAVRHTPNARSATFVSRDTLLGVREEGARISDFVPEDMEPTHRVGRVLGIVRDSASASGGLAGARVVVIGTTLGVRTDSAGRFFFDRVPVGSAVLRVDHERLRLFNVQSRLTVTVVADSSTFVSLKVPVGIEALNAVCSSSDANMRYGAVVGRVVDATLGHGVTASTVTVNIRPSPAASAATSRAVKTSADPFGHFAVCGLPAGSSIALTVAADGYRDSHAFFGVVGGSVHDRRIELTPCPQSPEEVECDREPHALLEGR